MQRGAGMGKQVRVARGKKWKREKKQRKRWEKITNVLRWRKGGLENSKKETHDAEMTYQRTATVAERDAELLSRAVEDLSK